jgi:formate hydrogenlyase subunit 4
MNIINSTVSTIVILALAPLLTGLIRKFKAFFGNRAGAPVLQPYRSLLVLMRKEMTISKHSSWVFRAVPYVVFGCTLLVAVLAPTLFSHNASIGNFFLISAFLMVGASALVLGGMDAASAFGGMGSSREMTIAMLTEPVVILVFVALGATTGSWSAGGALQIMAMTPWWLAHPFLVLVFAAFAMVVLAEGARYPVDNPTTHLELTMVHEAMVLEYSGPYLAMLEYASMLKYAVLAVLFANLLMPLGIWGTGSIAFLPGLAFFALKLVAVGFLTALLESTIAKMRFYRLQEYFTTAYLLAFFGLLLSLVF